MLQDAESPEVERTGSGVIERAERARRAGDPVRAAAVAREALGSADDGAARAALALALLDLGQIDEARHSLERLLESLLGESVSHAGAGFDEGASAASVIADGTVAAATAATLELVSSLDDDDFDRAMEEAEAQRELMFDADSVAGDVLREVPAELYDELLPSEDSPFATRTFADLLERQGHEAQAESLRSSLARRVGDVTEEVAAIDEDTGRVLATLERWLENLRRTAT